jgi:hypothetical protein
MGKNKSKSIKPSKREPEKKEKELSDKELDGVAGGAVDAFDPQSGLPTGKNPALNWNHNLRAR